MKCFFLATATLLGAHIAAASSSAVTAADDFGPWKGTQLLTANIDYSVSWKLDTDTITLKLRAETSAWLGFGLGEFTSGSMLGADIVTVAVNDAGEPEVEDRHVPWQAFPLNKGTMPYPVKDTCQDWVSLFASEAVGENGKTYTTVVVRRRLVTDDIEDRAVEARLTRVIFAYGDETSKDTVAYHGAIRRGATVIDFGKSSASSPDSTDFLPDDVDLTKTIELLMGDYELPIQQTTYACETFNVSELAFGEDIIAVEPVIDPSNIEHLHHMLIHTCRPGSLPEFEDNPSQCFSPLASVCDTLLYMWAKGGSSLVLPLNVAFRGVSEVVVEIHYDSVVESGMTDSSGVRLYLAKAPREHEGVGLTLGVLTVPSGPILPAGTEEVHVQTNCHPDCTSKFTGDITVFASALHMHNVGKQVWTSHYDSDGNFMSILNRVDFWNNGFQQMADVQHTLSAGESLRTHCVYDTSRADADVPFGIATSEEMCFDFLFVYPKANLGGVFACGSDIYNHIFQLDVCLLSNDKGQQGAYNHGMLDPTPKSEGDYPLKITFSGAITTEQCADKVNTDDKKDDDVGLYVGIGFGVVFALALGVFLVKRAVRGSVDVENVSLNEKDGVLPMNPEFL